MKKLIILTIVLLLPLQAKAYTFIGEGCDKIEGYNKEKTKCNQYCDYFTYMADVANTPPPHNPHHPVTFCVVKGQPHERAIADILAHLSEHPKPMTKKELKSLAKMHDAEVEKAKKAAVQKPINPGATP